MKYRITHLKTAEILTACLSKKAIEYEEWTIGKANKRRPGETFGNGMKNRREVMKKRGSNVIVTRKSIIVDRR